MNTVNRWTPADIIRAAALAGLFALFGFSMWLTSHGHSHGEGSLILFGAVAAGLGSAVQYYFGSSQGSKDKTAGLLTLSQRAAEASDVYTDRATIERGPVEMHARHAEITDEDALELAVADYHAAE